MTQEKLRKLLQFLGEAWATFFFVGRCPWAPGTAGSLAALPLAWFVWQLPVSWAWAILAFVFATGVAASAVVGKRTGISDHQSIVIDEVVGILVTTSVAAHNWQQFALAFALFRFFDIVKPWPVSWIDRKWHSPLGTMMDDLLASIMAAAVLHSLLHHGPGGFIILL